MTGQPDFATVRITYVPDESIVELKSLKLYLWSYRDEGAFHEDVTNRILDDLVAAIAPRRHDRAPPIGSPAAASTPSSRRQRHAMALGDYHAENVASSPGPASSPKARSPCPTAASCSSR